MTATSAITNNEFVEPAIPDNETAAIHAINNEDDRIIPSLNVDKKINNKKKKRFSFFKAALVALRSDSKKKPAPKSEVAAADSEGKWKKIVGSMRPLHLQDNDSPPPSLPPPSPLRTAESFEDLNMIPQPSSPAPSSLHGDTMSQYASASNLQELDVSDGEEDDPDEVFDAIRGDEMIDAKAEEFIAKFYRQMKLQHH